MRSRICDNSESIEIGQVSNNEFFHGEGKTSVVRDAFISSSNGEVIVAKHIFSIASEMLSSPQPLEVDAPNTAVICLWWLVERKSSVVGEVDKYNWLICLLILRVVKEGDDLPLQRSVR